MSVTNTGITNIGIHVQCQILYNASTLSSNARGKNRRIPLIPTDRVQTHVLLAKKEYKSHHRDDKFNSRQGQKILLYVKASACTVGLTSGLHLQRYSGRSVKLSPSSGAKVHNAWRYSSAHAYVFMEWPNSNKLAGRRQTESLNCAGSNAQCGPSE